MPCRATANQHKGEQSMLMNNFLSGFMMVFGIETVRAVSNILFSYVAPSGRTLEQVIDSKTGGA